MSEDTKTELEQVKDVLNQLKEMHHYSKANVEKLTAIWMLFDGELASTELAPALESMMNQQGGFYDALVSTIADMEMWINRTEQSAE